MHFDDVELFDLLIFKPIPNCNHWRNCFWFYKCYYNIFLKSHLNQVQEDFLDDFDKFQIIEIGQNSKLNLDKIGNFNGIIMVPTKPTK